MTQQVQRLTDASVRPAPPVAETERAVGLYERVFKRAFDLAAGLVLFVIVLPITLLVAVAVWVDLGNPVILRQERIGKDGRRFKVYKFRTMQPDRRTAAGLSYVGADRRVVHKSTDDPRLTSVGRFLRKWSLDELPQLWNVLRGQMSLVGPRPELVQIVQQYEPWQHRRHEVKPGLTGLWQVSARGDGLMHHATHIDLEYVDSLSFRSDLRILVKTIPAALGDRTGH